MGRRWVCCRNAPYILVVSQLRSYLLCVVLHRVHFAHPVLTIVTPASGLGEMEDGEEGGCRLSEALVERDDG